MLNVVILAAGLGKRMQSDLPKVLHTLAGKPMLAHVLASARELAPARITVVVGHGADRVKQAFGGRKACTSRCSSRSRAPATPCSKPCRCCSRATARTM